MWVDGVVVTHQIMVNLKVLGSNPSRSIILSEVSVAISLSSLAQVDDLV